MLPVAVERTAPIMWLSGTNDRKNKLLWPDMV